MIDGTKYNCAVVEICRLDWGRLSRILSRASTWERNTQLRISLKVRVSLEKTEAPSMKFCWRTRREIGGSSKSAERNQIDLASIDIRSNSYGNRTSIHAARLRVFHTLRPSNSISPHNILHSPKISRF
jgi:hypothetical protein